MKAKESKGNLMDSQVLIENANEYKTEDWPQRRESAKSQILPDEYIFRK